mgnify:CR=1 FL=1
MKLQFWRKSKPHMVEKIITNRFLAVGKLATKVIETDPTFYKDVRERLDSEIVYFKNLLDRATKGHKNV